MRPTTLRLLRLPRPPGSVASSVLPRRSYARWKTEADPDWKADPTNARKRSTLSKADYPPEVAAWIYDKKESTSALPGASENSGPKHKELQALEKACQEGSWAKAVELQRELAKDPSLDSPDLSRLSLQILQGLLAQGAENQDDVVTADEFFDRLREQERAESTHWAAMIYAAINGSTPNPKKALKLWELWSAANRKSLWIRENNSHRVVEAAYTAHVAAELMVSVQDNYLLAEHGDEATETDTVLRARDLLSDQELKKEFDPLPIPNPEVMEKVLNEQRLSPSFIRHVVTHAQRLKRGDKRINSPQFHGLVRIYCSARKRKRVLYEYESAKAQTEPMSERTYAVFISGFFLCHEWQLGMKVWQDMIKSGVRPTVLSWNALIVGAGYLGNLVALRETWAKMQRSGFVPDVVLWSSYIKAFFVCKDTQGALDAISGMEEAGVQWNSVTRTIIVDGLVRHNLPKEARHVLEVSLKQGMPPNVRVYNVFLRDCLDYGNYPHASFATRMQNAHKILDEMTLHNITPDEATYTTLIGGIARWGRNPKALEASIDAILRRMVEAGLAPSVVTYTTVINGLIEGADPASFENYLVAAEHMFRSMLATKKIAPNVQVFTAMIKGYMFAGRTKQATETYAMLQKMDISPDLPIFNTFIRGYSRVEDLDGMIYWHEKMLDYGYRPNKITYSYLFNGLAMIKTAEARRWTEKFLGDMIRDGFLVESPKLSTAIVKATGRPPDPRLLPSNASKMDEDEELE
ncbi:hypothetical protein SAICODRAFT_17742, partial [Saitoella complicata NRRL Y-17804]|uniref:Pentacotripeptide-repeat region of PRORP domain-containing protein n=1 Tax=Saitoella complicata (strain BCRC 22490 / CBS 7301 / JCM 7358 / NBRC 10748 / NRRL Y-17804) TaxID=698492 RepID=A0A0E9NQN2_SAICN